METLATQFDHALKRIEVNGTKRFRASTAHIDVRAVLETSRSLREVGVDTLLIGSYARNTGIYPGKDVDVFAKLTGLDTAASPKEVFDSVRDLLTEHYGDRATPQARSVKVQFSSDESGADVVPSNQFSVDVVPAVHAGDRWAIPARDPNSWAGDEGRWILTDPESLSMLTTAANEQTKVVDRGAYIPIVKLMRQTRQHHRGSSKPGGLYIEMATYDAFLSGVTGTSFAELFASTLRAVASRLLSTGISPLVDPALGTAYHPTPDPADLAATAQLFSSLADTASQALREDVCQAAVLWRGILGSNDRGHVFPLPPGCDEAGRVVPPVIANLGRGSDEAKSFA